MINSKYSSVDYCTFVSKSSFLSEDNSFYYAPISGDKYPIIDGIPRFCPQDNYSKSFGYQWNLFDRNQLDNYSGVDQSYHRFYNETLWDPEELSRCTVLEVEAARAVLQVSLFAYYNWFLHSVDYSSAVEVNLCNNWAYAERLKIALGLLMNCLFR